MCSLTNNFKEITVTTTDGEKIAFNLYENGFSSVLIIAPGWFMTKDTVQFREISDAFCEFTDVICMDFRGHGRSSGFYTFSAKEKADLAAVAALAKKSYQTVNLLGFSLGGTISIQYCCEDLGVCKLITVSAPCDFNRVENHMYSPNAFVPTIQKWIRNEKNKIHPRNIRPGFPLLPKIKAQDVVKNIKIPHLLMAGDKDPTVFKHHTETLFKINPDNAKLVIYKDCFHAEDIFYQNNEEFMTECKNWLNN